MEIKDKKRFIALFLTGIILTVLVLSGPANAYNLGFSVIDEQDVPGNEKKIMFDASIDLQEGDNFRDIKACFKFAKRAKVDILMAQYLTPYPKTKLRDRLLKTGLVEYKDDYSRYNGFQPVARTMSLTIKQLERYVIWSNIIWYLSEVLNPANWFVKSKRVLRHVYIRIVVITLVMIFDFARGRYGKSFHRI